MKTLLVYPEFPDTYWSFRHALSFEGKRSAYPSSASRPSPPCCLTPGNGGWWI
jgi:hypothetical protein